MSTETAPASKPRRLAVRRPRDMIISLAVLLVPIGVIFLGWRFLMSGQDVTPVDFDQSVAEARRAGLPVVEPAGLGAEWVPISHSVDGGDGSVTLRIGYHTPDDAGLQLVESHDDPASVLDSTLTEEPKRTGQTELAGRQWTVYTADNGNHAYVATTEDMTIAVVGGAAEAELDEFAGALN